MLRKQVVRIGVGLAIVAAVLACATAQFRPAPLAALERTLYDARLRLTMPGTPDPRITIVDIDERSLAALGRWPWRRDRMARLVDHLFDRYHVQVAGLDIIMAEADDSAGLGALETLSRGALRDDMPFRAAFKELRPQLDVDGAFAAALAHRPVVLGFYLSNEGVSSGALPPAAIGPGSLSGHTLPTYAFQNYGGSLARFQAVAAGGHVNPVVDADGAVRRVPLLVRHGGQYYEAFSVALVRAYLGGAALQPVFASADPSAPLEKLDLFGTAGGLVSAPVDERTAAWVPYRGPAGSFTYVSAADVIAGTVAPELLRARIVIVGTTAPGLRDMRATPVGEIYPGMEVHANLVSGMLDGRILQRPDYSDALDLLQLLVLGAILLFAVRWQRPFVATMTTLGLLVVVMVANVAAWTTAKLIVPLATPLVLMGMLYVWNMSYGYFMETRAKARIAQRFGQYVPPELVRKMVEDPSRYSMQGRRAELTVLFSDVRGFTSIAEKLEPQALAELMNQYLSAMTLIIRRYGGTLDKYIGDAIVAFWGAPVDDPDHARHAVMAALAMQAELDAVNTQFAANGWPAIQIGIGVNTGPMTVGDMGSRIRLAYTVMGDAVNLAARLESKTKEYGLGILVGEATRAAVPDLAFDEIDYVQVKGKETAVHIFCPQPTSTDPVGAAGPAGAAVETQSQTWQVFLRHYQAGAWDNADAVLGTLLARDPARRLYQLYAQRVAERRTDPDLSWNGITRFDSK